MIGFILIIIYLLLNGCQAFICPPNDVLNGCECSPYPRPYLYCGESRHVPWLNGSYNFSYILLYRSQFANIRLRGVTTTKLMLKEIVGVQSVQPLIDLQFRELELRRVGTQVTEALFAIGSQHLVSIIIERFNDPVFDLKFAKFPNLESIHFEGTGRRDNVMKTFGANVFANLPKLTKLELHNLNIVDLGANSLRFSTRQHLYVDLSHNKITRPSQLNKSGLSLDNDVGTIEVNLNFNGFKTLPESVFRKYCTNESRITIKLNSNPIQCKYDEIKWIFAHNIDKYRLKDVFCYNHNKRDLLYMSESDFNGLIFPYE